MLFILVIMPQPCSRSELERRLHGPMNSDASDQFPRLLHAFRAILDMLKDEW